MTKIRKHTKFQTCEKHRWLDTVTSPGSWVVSRERRAEMFMEGGPANAAGCEGGLCRIWPGTDLFCSDICTSEFPLDWTKNERIEQ